MIEDRGKMKFIFLFIVLSMLIVSSCGSKKNKAPNKKTTTTNNSPSPYPDPGDNPNPWRRTPPTEATSLHCADITHSDCNPDPSDWIKAGIHDGRNQSSYKTIGPIIGHGVKNASFRHLVNPIILKSAQISDFDSRFHLRIKVLKGPFRGSTDSYDNKCEMEPVPYRKLSVTVALKGKDAIPKGRRRGTAVTSIRSRSVKAGTLQEGVCASSYQDESDASCKSGTFHPHPPDTNDEYRWTCRDIPHTGGGETECRQFKSYTKGVCASSYQDESDASCKSGTFHPHPPDTNDEYRWTCRDIPHTGGGEMKCHESKSYIQYTFKEIPVDGISKVYRFNVPIATALTFDIRDIEWDYWGKIGESTTYGPMHAVWYRDCVRIEVQYATDTRTDLPGPKIN